MGLNPIQGSSVYNSLFCIYMYIYIYQCSSQKIIIERGNARSMTSFLIASAISHCMRALRSYILATCMRAIIDKQAHDIIQVKQVRPKENFLPS